MNKKRLIYLIFFLMFLFIEVLIAQYVHDEFVRPYVGDMLVVVVIYFFVKIFLPAEYKWLPGAIFLFAALVELLQYFRLVEILGVENNVFLRTLIGSTFDVKDILCYGVGCVVLAVGEWLMREKHIKTILTNCIIMMFLVGCSHEAGILGNYTEEQLSQTHETVVDEEQSLSEEDYGLLMDLLNSKDFVKGT